MCITTVINLCKIAWTNAKKEINWNRLKCAIICVRMQHQSSQMTTPFSAQSFRKRKSNIYTNSLYIAYIQQTMTIKNEPYWHELYVLDRRRQQTYWTSNRLLSISLYWITNIFIHSWMLRNLFNLSLSLSVSMYMCAIRKIYHLNCRAS